jgi:hypothetical protein
MSIAVIGLAKHEVNYIARDGDIKYPVILILRD